MPVDGARGEGRKPERKAEKKLEKLGGKTKRTESEFLNV
jgi:hypothetical protein